MGPASTLRHIVEPHQGAAELLVAVVEADDVKGAHKIIMSVDHELHHHI